MAHCEAAMSLTCPQEDVPAGGNFRRVVSLVATSNTGDMMSAMTSTRTRRNVPRLMGAAEAAEALGVAQPNLRPIPGLPAPICTLRCGSIWLADEIERFAEGRKARSTERVAVG